MQWKLPETFFKSILKLAKNMGDVITFETKSLRDVLDKQRYILRWFVKKCLISEGERGSYELTSEDFPPIWFI